MSIMNSPEATPQPLQHEKQLTYTLEPLRTEGQDALTPDPSEGIIRVRLRQLQLTWNNAFHKAIITKSDDIFSSTAAEDPASDPIPEGPALTQAILDFEFPESAAPHSVEISPPKTMRLESQRHASRIIAFLAKHHFLQACQQTAALLLLVAVAVLPATRQAQGTSHEHPPARAIK